jgi:hypothetical protein
MGRRNTAARLLEAAGPEYMLSGACSDLSFNSHNDTRTN